MKRPSKTTIRGLLLFAVGAGAFFFGASLSNNGGDHSFLNSALLFGIQLQLLYMFHLSREWSAPRVDAKLECHEEWIERLEGNQRGLRERLDAKALEDERDAFELRKEIRSLIAAVRESTLLRDEVRVLEARVDAHEQELAAMRPPESKVGG